MKLFYVPPELFLTVIIVNDVLGLTVVEMSTDKHTLVFINFFKTLSTV